MKTFVLWQKELRQIFYSPLFYILGAFFTIIVGLLFYNYLGQFPQLGQQKAIQVIVRPLFGNINFFLMFITPLFTMNALAQESRRGTMDLLLLAPMSHTQILLAKFFAVLTQILALLVLTSFFPIIMLAQGYTEWGVMATSYLGLIGVSSCYIAVGLFASSMFRSPVLSAFVSFAILMFLILLVMSGQLSANPMVGMILQYFSLAVHFEPFSRGVMRSYDMLYFVSFCFLFLFCAKRILDLRRW